ncbi:MAG: DUF3861 domain-containing protein [Bacteroides sp.]|nr:DUF3861 domain-containing protein [Bacteroides sp.]MCM1413606.1 DUF3861 domain-containing protein [Bacteroides sp.]MCM1471177.1 DUF3861 domain-containing protein [Bacteroides sp.]
MKEKRSYYVNMIESRDGKMNEVLNFNFGGHHDFGRMVELTRQAGWFEKDKYAKEFVLAMRFMHHVIKKNPDNALFQEFGPQFESFKAYIKEAIKANCTNTEPA